MFFHLLLIFEYVFNSRFFKRLNLSLFGFIFVAFSTHALAENSKILVYGDSLSAAYGIAQPQGWVTLLQQKLNAEGYHYEVANASISGETTSGGLTRFEKTITTTKPKIVILALGANDGLRGLPIQEMQMCIRDRSRACQKIIRVITKKAGKNLACVDKGWLIVSRLRIFMAVRLRICQAWGSTTANIMPRLARKPKKSGVALAAGNVSTNKLPANVAKPSCPM